MKIKKETVSKDRLWNLSIHFPRLFRYARYYQLTKLGVVMFYG